MIVGPIREYALGSTFAMDGPDSTRAILSSLGANIGLRLVVSSLNRTDRKY